MQEEFFIIKHPKYGHGIVTKIKTFESIQDKWHIAYSVFTMTSFFNRGDFEEVKELPFYENGFNRDELNRLTN